MAHCPTLMMSSAGSPSRRAWRWPSQSPTTIAVAMRMPYQRMTIGPSWKAIAPGELIARGCTHRRIPRRFVKDQRLEHRWSQVLPAGAVLRKQHWPGIRIRVDARDDAPPADPDRAAGPQHRDGFGDSADDRFLVPTPRPASGWPRADGRGGRIRT